MRMQNQFVNHCHTFAPRASQESAYFCVPSLLNRRFYKLPTEFQSDRQLSPAVIGFGLASKNRVESYFTIC